MTLDNLDREVTAWEDRRRLIDENLNSFVELPACRRICGADLRTPQPFTGDTEAAVAAAFTVLGRLRGQQGLLDQTLRKVAELRNSLSRLMPSRQTLDEIGQLLSGQSIELGTATTPPERRELLRDVNTAVRVSPAELLEMMEESFRYFRDTVLAVAATQDRNAAELDHLRSELSQHPVIDATGAAAWSLDEAAALSALDPLAAAAKLAAVAQQIQVAVDSAKSVERRRREITDALAAADALAARLADAHGRAVKLVAERSLKIGRAILPTVDDREISSVLHWLETLRDTAARGELGPASVGLRNWTRAAERMLGDDQAAADSAESALRARRDLRGLFGALKAKAAATPSPQLSALAREIDALFSARPTPMERAKELVSRYQQQII